MVIWHSWRQRLAWFIGLVLAAALAASVVLALVQSRATTRRLALQEANGLASTLAAELLRALETLDHSLMGAVRGMRIPELNTLSPEVRSAVLFDSSLNANDYVGVSISDAQGNVLFIYSNQGTSNGTGGQTPLNIEPVTGLDVRDREYFKRHVQNPDLDRHVGDVVLARRTGERMLVVSRRYQKENGDFGGVIAGGLRLGTITSLFRSIDLDRRGVISLVRQDGVQIAREPSQRRTIRRNDDANQQDLPVTPGVFDVVDPIDGFARLGAAVQVGKLPLVVSVSFSSDDVYAEWNQTALTAAVALLIMLFLGAGLSMMLRHELRRRAQAEKASNLSEQLHASAIERLDAVFNNSADAMSTLSVTPDGGFIYEKVNRVWERRHGVAASAAVGRSPLECLPPDIGRGKIERLKHCVAIGAPYRFSELLHRDDGAVEDWETVLSPTHNESGAIVRLIGVARNMTERNQLEARVRQSQRMAAMEQLTSGVAHDFNNMLQAMMVRLDLVRLQPELSEKTRAAVEKAQGAVMHGAALTHRLLAFTRKQSLRPTALRPAEVLANVKSFLERSLGSRIRLHVSAADPLPDINADETQLELCLVNLALNARDAMPDGGTLEMHVSLLTDQAAADVGLPPASYVVFDVTDDGKGMKPETLARAFEPFFTTKPLGEGSGLGLSMVQGFMRQSGGDVRITSSPGQGTRVSLVLPAMDVGQQVNREATVPQF